MVCLNPLAPSCDNKATDHVALCLGMEAYSRQFKLRGMNLAFPGGRSLIGLRRKRRGIRPEEIKKFAAGRLVDKSNGGQNCIAEYNTIGSFQ
jgi:hypothetical protein